MNKIILMLVVVLVQRGSALEKKEPSQTIFLTASHSQIIGSMNLAGGYSTSFMPSLQSENSFIDYSQTPSSIKGKTLFNCPQPDCSISSPLTQSQQTGFTDMIITAGFNSLTTLKLDTLTLKAFPLLLATITSNRQFLTADASLSFSNHDNSFVSQLYAQKLINNNKFAVYLSDQQNIITIGTSISYLAQGQSYIFTPNNNNGGWQLQMAKVQWNNNNIQQLLLQSTYQIYFDLSTPNIVMPQSFISQYLIDNPSCQYNNQIVCNCNGDINKVGTIAFQFKDNNQLFTLNPSDYVSLQNNQCLLKIEKQSSLSNLKFVLGQVFFNKFYMVFDRQNQQITITQKSTNIIESPVQSQSTVISVIFIGLLFILIALIFLCCVCFKDIKDIPQHVTQNYAKKKSNPPQIQIQQEMQQQQYVQQQPIQRTFVAQQPINSIIQSQNPISQQQPTVIRTPVNAVYQSGMQNSNSAIYRSGQQQFFPNQNLITSNQKLQ